jgi:hypothetical protein
MTSFANIYPAKEPVGLELADNIVRSKGKLRMDFQLTFFGELVFYSIFIVGGLSYYLGKRKTSNARVATLVGILLCLTPPLNLVYLFVLTLKNDEVPAVENQS